MNFRFIFLSILNFSLLFVSIGCDDSRVDSSVLSQGAKMSPEELEKIDNLDKASYAELSDLFLDNRRIDPQGRYLMIVFGNNGCLYCEKLKQDIKENQEIKDFIKENFSPYYVNGSYSKPHHFITSEHQVQMMTSELLNLYQIRPTPTLIFATSEGKTILAYPGYLPVPRFKATLEFITQEIWKGASDEKEIRRRLVAFYQDKNL